MAFECTSPAAVKYEALCAYIRVRCRNCENCLEARRYVWRIRAAREQVHAKRTWFVTLTFGRKARARILEEAARYEGNASQADRLSRAAGWYVSTFMKRLRKAGFEVRYLFIAEPHGDGFPHFHGLIHDQRGDLPSKVVLKRDKKTKELKQVTVCPAIEACFNAGWIDTELVRDKGAIFYVTKYIAKGRYGRARASLDYGGADLIADEQSRAQAKACKSRPKGSWRRGSATIMSSKTTRKEGKEFLVWDTPPAGGEAEQALEAEAEQARQRLTI